MTETPDYSRRNTPTIALLTCRHHDHIDHAAEGRLMQELVRQGAAVSLVAWDDVFGPLKPDSNDEAAIMYHGGDLIVLRTTWDYWDRLDEFRKWLNQFEDDPRLCNAYETIIANLDKTYLAQLEAAGVPIVPTIFVTKDNEAAAIAQAKSNGWSPLIIKPMAGAAAVGLKKLDHPDAAALDYLRELTSSGGALVQPYLPRITTEGETSMVYFDGRFSHAVTKVPAPGDFRSQTDFGGAYTLVEPTPEQIRVAERALTAWEKHYNDKPLYARADLVPGNDGGPLLGELELIEPELFLDMADHAATTFATAILARVKVPTYTPESRWKVLLTGIGCFVVAGVVLFIFFAGVVAILVSLFGGP